MKPPFNPLRIRSKDEFVWLIEHLRTETHRVRDHWNLWRALDSELDAYCVEFHQSPRFWALTKRALQDSVVLRLGRLFDPTKGALSLGNLVETIRHGAARGSTNFFGFDLGELDANGLMQELRSVSESDPAVAILLTVRNQYLAHREARLVGSGSFSKLPELALTDIDGLVEKAAEIANRYSRLCGLAFVSSTLPGADDYRHLLDSVRAAVACLKQS